MPLDTVPFVDHSSPVSTPALLDWQTVHKNLPWSVVLLLGGGFALAYACKVTIQCILTQNTDWRDTISGVQVSPGSAETLVRERWHTNHHSDIILFQQ